MSKYRALIVEDSPTMRQFLGLALNRIEGMTYDEATDGIDALRILKNEKYDLVLLDINMPKMDGLQLLSTIRSDKSLDDMRVVMVTTEGQTSSYEKALSLGADGYLAKPVQAKQVIDSIRKILEQ